MGDETEERPEEGKNSLVAVFSAFGGDALRDVWLFDQSDHEALCVREDVEQKVADLDVEMFVDNERYGFVTRDTYADLYYADYGYTVRGFDGFEQFRTFLTNDETKVGVFASFDRRDGGYDFGELQANIEEVVGDYPADAFTPN